MLSAIIPESARRPDRPQNILNTIAITQES
jgi:hypothetical protein